MGEESEEDNNNKKFFDGTRWRKKTKAELEDEDYWEFIASVAKRPMLRCPYCDFKNVFEESIKHHIQFTKRPGHPKEKKEN